MDAFLGRVAASGADVLERELEELYDEPEEEEQMEKDPLVQTEAVGRMWTEKEKVELPAHEGDRARRPRRAETWACSAQPRGTRLGVMESLNNTFEMNPDKALKLDRGEPEPEMPVAASALAHTAPSLVTIEARS